ncbi:SMN family protein Smn1 [Dissoconium aciculare CBS 342.82]|uniref:SMN family protein Smn1 n=1 Tax=Dissoconium aciculare CBS 342.82 TaxID=1314786 RepID=A0A6J3LX69_9PEZI|nr:SMN family protein Smn1 [Dissoconium aciculare CBS 342.82]KAF1820346.1 SMN family protein Smn1 [Dissoconium aciculare CBS 342.82]
MTGGYGADDKWDDSELLNDWNQALEEYKKYHSLAVKGEKVDAADIVKQQEPAAETTNDDQNLDAPSVPQYAGSTPLNFTAGPGGDSNAAENVHSQSSSGAFPAPPGIPTIPQALLGSSQDENMKNIMMSWYYAGYYTGLYDGQQKAYASMQEGK